MKKMMVFLMTILTASVFAQSFTSGRLNSISTNSYYTDWFQMIFNHAEVYRFFDWNKNVVCYKIDNQMSCIKFDSNKKSTINNNNLSYSTFEFSLNNMSSGYYRLDDNQTGVSCYYKWPHGGDTISCLSTEV